MFRISPTTDIQLVKALHDQLFPDTDFEGPSTGNVYWLVLDEHGGAVGFCSVRPHSAEPDTVFLSRSGVLPSVRGIGLQKRLIRARLAWARRNGYLRATSYCYVNNIASARSLLRCGFLPYLPERRLSGPDEWLYLERWL